MSKTQQHKEVSNIPQEGVLLTLSLSDIAVDDTCNVSRYSKYDPKAIAELAESIKERQQLQPVVVRRNENRDGNGNSAAPYRLVAGFQRYKAIELANTEKGVHLPVLARLVEGDDRKALLDNLAENIKRKGQSPMDVSYSVKALSDAGLTQREIAAQYGKSASWVNNHAAFTTLRPQIQKAIHSGEIPFTAARNLPGLEEAEQDELLEVIREAMAMGRDSAEAAKDFRHAKKGKKDTGRKAKGQVAASSGGITAKAALDQFERLTLELKEVEKPNKVQAKLLTVYGILTKFLQGKLGAQSMYRKLLECL